VNVGAHRSLVRRLVRMCGVLAVGGGSAGERPFRRMSTALALSVAALLVLSAGVAQAEPPTLIPYGQFESTGALGVAVDGSAGPSQGDVYIGAFIAESEATGLTLGSVNKHDPSGKLISPPSPFGAANSFEENGSAYSGAAVNPTNGDVDVLEAFKSEIDVYDPSTGALLISFPVTASSNFEFLIPWTVVGISTDSAGNVYVPVVPENKVLEYSSTGTLLATFTGSGSGVLKAPTAVAVDSSGNLWVADSGNERIEELSPADAPIAEIPSEGVVQSVAVDSHGHVFAIVKNSADFCGSLEPPCSHFVEYSSAGAQLIDLGAGEFGDKEGGKKLTGPPSMVAVNDSSGRVYVTDWANNRVFIYTPPTPPKLESELAVGVTTSEVKLGALVNPGGIGASYRFEYGTTTAYGHTAPFPEGDAGTGLKSRTVWAGPSGLQPGTTYHYRVVVKNELGEVTGEDKTFTTETAVQAACPNDLLRTGFSAALPDCRAYELVTPPNKLSAQAVRDICNNGRGECPLQKTLVNDFAAPDGNRLTLHTEDVLPGSQSGGEVYLASRGPEGWSLENEIPSQNYYARGEAIESDSHSEDFSKSIIAAVSGGVGGLEPELISGEPRGTQNLYLRDNTTGAYQLINLTPAGATPAAAQLVGAARDFSRVVFTEQAQLTPDALPGVENLYEWSAGQVRLVSLLPSTETPVAGSFVAISTDGSRIFFKAGGDLYARVNGAETVQLDASQAVGTGGGGEFVAASQDGSKVLFSDNASAALTADTVPGSATNLYLYDSSAPAGQRLSDLTPVSKAGAPALVGLSKDGSQVFFTDDASAALTADTAPGSAANLYRYDSAAPVGLRLTDVTTASHAEVQRVFSVSEDGSSVYFTAGGVLTGSQANQHGETAVSGEDNLYLWHDGTTSFITAHGPSNQDVFQILKVSANGDFLALQTTRSLAGFDNIDQNTGNPDSELYVYDASANSLACASCNPSGEPPTAGAGFEISRPGARNLTENGRLFFDSTEALLPSDTNGAGGCPAAPSGNPSCLDVYEFEPAGVGTCAESAGCLFLISTGTSTLETAFVDASANGDDVFIREYQKLVPRDTQEGAPTVYDVRVDGGFPEPAVSPACVTADACRSAPAPQPSIFGEPASQTFSGLGNLTPTSEAKVKVKPKSKPVKCKKGSVKKKGKCVKKAKKSGKKARKSAHANKRTGK
jgi:NHL repeat